MHRRLQRSKSATQQRELRIYIGGAMPATVDKAGGARHAVAVGQLLMGDTGRAVDGMLSELGGAAGNALADRIAGSSDPVLLTDLSAALFERARQQSRADDLADGFSAAARAVDLAPALPEGWFSYALFCEAFHLRTEARRAWRKYLELDPDSAWAAEAREHLAAVSRREKPKPVSQALLAAALAGDQRKVTAIVESDRQGSRIFAEDKLFGAWGALSQNGDAAAAETLLGAIRLVGNELARVSGDRTVANAAERLAIRQTPSGNQDPASAYRAYADARLRFSVARNAISRDAMSAAADLLDRIGSPLAFRARIYAATIDHYAGSNDRATQQIEACLARIGDERAHYPIATGQALWTRGLILFAQGSPHDALVADQTARRSLAAAGEPSNLAGIDAVLTEIHRYLGDTDGAWRYQLLALDSVDRSATYTRRQLALSEASLSALALGHLRLADVFACEVVADAERQRDVLLQVQGLVMRSRVAIARRAAGEALGFLARASSALERTPPTASTLRLVPDVAIARAEILMQTQPAVAIGELETARQRLTELDHRSRLPALHLTLARAYLRMRNAEAAEAELRRGVNEVEMQRQHLADAAERSQFTDTGRALYDELVQLLADRERGLEALSVARRARNVGLTMPGGALSVVAQPMARLGGAADHTLIEYYVLPKTLLIWISSGGQAEFVRRDISAVALAATVERATAAIRTAERATQCARETAELFDLLLRPVIGSLPATTDVVIAPDGILHTVPFCALLDSRTGRFVIEEHAVTILVGQGPSRSRSGYASMLVVSAPGGVGSLPFLANAAREANRVARHSAGGRLLSGGEATAENFLASADQFDAVHFAGHAEANGRQPRLAVMHFAASAERPDGALYAYEIETKRFFNTRLAVLAACDTAQGPLTGSGLLSFARTFIDAGVPDVVASLWPADDAASSRLFPAFYASLAKGRTPPVALQEAQKAAIERDRNGPLSWAVFQMYSSDVSGITHSR